MVFTISPQKRFEETIFDKFGFKLPALQKKQLYFIKHWKCTRKKWIRINSLNAKVAII